LAEKDSAHKPIEAGLLGLCHSSKRFPLKMSRSGLPADALIGGGFWPEAETKAIRHDAEI
jgi:hypothetical protein